MASNLMPGPTYEEAVNWDETLLWREFQEMRQKLTKFMADNKDGLPTVEMKVLLETADWMLERAEEDITGKID